VCIGAAPFSKHCGEGEVTKFAYKLMFKPFKTPFTDIPTEFRIKEHLKIIIFNS
jgi:hypothetical protein